MDDIITFKQIDLVGVSLASDLPTLNLAHGLHSPIGFLLFGDFQDGGTSGSNSKGSLIGETKFIVSDFDFVFFNLQKFSVQRGDAR